MNNFITKDRLEQYRSDGSAEYPQWLWEEIIDLALIGLDVRNSQNEVHLTLARQQTMRDALRRSVKLVTTPKEPTP